MAVTTFDGAPDPLDFPEFDHRGRFKSAKKWSEQHAKKRARLAEHNELRALAGLPPETYAQFYYDSKE